MFKVRNIAVILGLLLLVMPFSGLLAQDGTIVDVAAGNEDFSTLVDLVTAADLVETLSGEGPFTVFAPTNEAFAALPGFAIDYLLANPDVLTQVLTYHVLDGAVMAADVSTMMAPSLDMGNELDIVADDMGVTVNGANVVATDVAASNGVIHVIDTVLIPPVELEEVVPAFVEGNIIAAGSSTVFPLSDAVATRFRDEGYAGNITVDSIGSGAGFERFCTEGVTDISNASRPIRDTEIEACNSIGRDVFPIRVGTDALAVVLNAENDFAGEMTLEELALAFSTADTWQDVNPDWPAEPIERFIPGTDSGTFDYFVEEVFDENEEPILAAARTSLSEDDNVLVTGVEGNPYAIAFFGYAYFSENQEALNAVSVEGIVPGAASVNAGTYPLARPLFMYSAPEIIAEKPQIGEFLSYYLQVVDEEVTGVGYFPADAAGLNTAIFLVKAAIEMGMM